MSVYAYGNATKGTLELMEDSCVVKKVGDYIVLIVADGNGGNKSSINYGALASSLMLDYLNKIIKQDTSIIDIKNQLSAGMYMVSRCFITANALDEKFANVYASMAVVVISEASMEMAFASIGNAEIQLVRRGSLARLNHVHSEAHMLLEKGEIPEEDIYAHPKRGILTSALGVYDNPTIDIFSAPMQPNDILFLATDGVFRTMTPTDVLTEMVSHEGSRDELRDGVEAVLHRCNTDGGLDNCSLICAFFQI